MGERAAAAAVTAGGRAALLAVLLLGCASARRVPETVRGYDILVPGRDTLSRAMAGALARAGLDVRRTPKGGARAVAALVVYEFRHAGRGGRAWLFGRLFDARSGQLVAAAELPLDSLPAAARGRAQALVTALLAPGDTTATLEIPSN